MRSSAHAATGHGYGGHGEAGGYELGFGAHGFSLFLFHLPPRPCLCSHCFAFAIIHPFHGPMAKKHICTMGMIIIIGPCKGQLLKGWDNIRPAVPNTTL